ncbi:MAG TPA: Hsp70 family protein [Kofleriaceae bacterium]|nr:Hsp70 family protein [Kofleriaceae bacterium]
MTAFVGIDFGTTNTAVAVADASGRSRLVALAGPDGAAPTWRTILYFEESDVTAGSYAIARYLAGEGDGRLVQSIKSHLASRSFTQTVIAGRTWTLERLVAVFLHELRRAASVDLGNRAVVGRPVRYWGSSGDADDARALERMTTALRGAGFDEVRFEAEPIAAAAAYAARLDHDELVLVADIGGGTSDFSLVRVGPGAAGDAAAVLATGGVAIGGDTFDAEIIDAVIAPLLGKGTQYRDEMGARTPVPAWLFGHLRRWHQLSFLKSRDTLQLLERIHTGALDRGRIGNLVHVIDEDMGLPLHRAVEAAKVRLSDQPAADLRFTRAPVALAAPLARADFERWIAGHLDAVDRVITGVLERAGVAAAEVDRVFATGGSSFVPALRARLAVRFGAGRVVGGEELTSVASGLAVRARARFS